MFEQWMMTTWPKAGLVFLSAAGIYAAVIACTRLSGLRSFSKMSSFDFAMTIGIGTLLAGTLTKQDPPLLQGVVAAMSLFALQFIVAIARRKWEFASKVVDNEPVLLMVGPSMIHANLAQSRVTENDLFAKLREANVLSLAQVRAVVLETTGDISVLHTNDSSQELEDVLLTGVRNLTSNQLGSGS